MIEFDAAHRPVAITPRTATTIVHSVSLVEELNDQQPVSRFNLHEDESTSIDIEFEGEAIRVKDNPPPARLSPVTQKGSMQICWRIRPDGVTAQSNGLYTYRNGQLVDAETVSDTQYQNRLGNTPQIQSLIKPAFTRP